MSAEQGTPTVQPVVGSDSGEVCALKNQCIDLSFEIAALTMRLSDACDHIDKLVATIEGRCPPGHPYTLINAHRFSNQMRDVWLAKTPSREAVAAEPAGWPDRCRCGIGYGRSACSV